MGAERTRENGGRGDLKRKAGMKEKKNIGVKNSPVVVTRTIFADR